MIACAKKMLACPCVILCGILFLSVFALAAALTAQFAYNLEPCILCLYQRVPFLVAVVLALFGLAFKPARRIVIGLCVLVFATNTGIAFYHFGVEQRWWVSVFEGCAVPSEFFNPAMNDTRNLLEELMKKPSVPCSQVAWVDPIFGMSMAFYNILLCAGMFVSCSISFVATKRPLPSA